jgi:uncharacterized protein DUF6979
VGQYGRAASIAVRILAAGAESEPRTAWRKAIRSVTNSRNSQKKGCPEASFLSLCSAGAVSGVSAGTYTTAPKNGGDVIRALEVLRRNPDLAEDRSALWAVATKNSGKGQNGQMDVLLGLWDDGCLK